MRMPLVILAGTLLLCGRAWQTWAGAWGDSLAAPEVEKFFETVTYQ